VLKKILYASLSVAIFAFVCLSSTFTGGCTKTIHDTTTVYDTLTIHDTTYTGSFLLGMLYDYGQQAILLSDPVADPTQSNVTIKWGSSSVTFPDKYIYPGYLAFQNDLFLSSSTDYTLALISPVGTSQGTIRLPQSTYITQPSYGDTLLVGNDVVVVWSTATNADYYSIYYGIDAYDSSGSYIDYYYLDTFVVNTSLTIASSHFSIPNAAYYDVWVDVYPCSGPPPASGSSGNMTGTIPGYLIGEGNGDYTDFYVGVPIAKIKQARKHEPPSRSERMQVYIDKLGKYR